MEAFSIQKANLFEFRMNILSDQKFRKIRIKYTGGATYIVVIYLVFYQIKFDFTDLTMHDLVHDVRTAFIFSRRNKVRI